MTLPGRVEGVISSAPGFDSDTIISAGFAQQCYALGYKFCLRYLSLDEELSGDVSSQEAIDILNSGLAVMPVQHAPRSPWSPSQSLGQQYGEYAASNAQNVGFPTGVNVWCDLEGPLNSAAQAQDVIDYCEAWYQAVEAPGYVPGLYVGAGSVLTGQQLYDLPFEHYWRSPSNVSDIPHRSYQLFQLFPSLSIDGVWIDVDVAQNDKLGGQAQWLRFSSDS